MNWLSKLLGGDRLGGRIYSTSSVEPQFRDAAELAISRNGYRIYKHLPEGQALLILKTTPPLVALIERQASFDGPGKDMILKAVYSTEGDAEATAAEIAELY